MFQNVSYEQIRGRMLARVSDKLDKREGAVIFDAVSPASMELMAVYIELERIIGEAYGDTASREYLILRCKERGISPYPAENAILRGEFSPADVDVTGKRFSLGELNYIAERKINDGVYEVKCETAGAVGNRFFGEMIPIDYVDGLESAALTSVLIPGEDEEDTEDLRKRYFDSFDVQAFGGNRADYIEKISAIAGVGGVKVTRVWNADIKPAELVPAESVSEWFKNNAETLPEDVRGWVTPTLAAAKSGKLTAGGCVLVTLLDSEYNTASEALIERVKETLDPSDSTGEGMGLAPIGHVVTVQSAVGVPINVSTNITFEAGYGWDNMQNAIESAVSDYLLELRKKWEDIGSLTVRISQIETRILDIEGIVDIADTTINGAAENITLGAYEVPVMGEVAANE
ncbi:MAG: baseplate J/gp47 family protein [Oscillospiraceae bacterium]